MSANESMQMRRQVNSIAWRLAERATRSTGRLRRGVGRGLRSLGRLAPERLDRGTALAVRSRPRAPGTAPKFPPFPFLPKCVVCVA